MPTPKPRPPARVWRKAPADLVACFEAALPRDARVERRQMFGCPCAFVGGQMFTGMHEHRVVVRLPAEACARLVAAEAAAPFEPMGRRMREYVVVPEPVVRDATALGRWMRRALRYAAALPPKRAARPAAAGARTRRR